MDIKTEGVRNTVRALREAYIEAFKLTWIRRVMNTEGIWQNLILQSININFLLKCGLAQLNDTITQTKNAFWKDTLIAWKKLQMYAI